MGFPMPILELNPAFFYRVADVPGAPFDRA